MKSHTLRPPRRTVLQGQTLQLLADWPRQWSTFLPATRVTGGWNRNASTYLSYSFILYPLVQALVLYGTFADEES